MPAPKRKRVSWVRQSVADGKMSRKCAVCGAVVGSSCLDLRSVNSYRRYRKNPHPER